MRATDKNMVIDIMKMIGNEIPLEWEDGMGIKIGP